MKRLKAFLSVGLWLVIVAALMVLAQRIPKAHAGDPQFWGNYPPEVKAWFPTVMQPGFEEFHDMGHSCCGIGEAFEGRITGEDPLLGIAVTIDDGKTAIPDGTVVHAPRSKIQTHFGNPFPDKVIVFIAIGSDIVYCLVPNTGS